MFRLLWPLFMMFGPQMMPRIAGIMPRIVKFVRAVYRMHFDHRVNLLIKFLIPLAVIYGISPVDLIKDHIPYGLGAVRRFHNIGNRYLAVLDPVPPGRGARAYGLPAAAAAGGPEPGRSGGRPGASAGRFQRR